MNYYYDILVNLQEEYYEFYEWEKSDCIIPIKKTPIFKVAHQTILDFLQKEITLDKDMLESLKGKTITKNKKEKLNCLLLTDSKTTIFVELNEKGKVIYRSKLLIEDENNINEISSAMKEEEILYTKGKNLPKRKELRRTLKEKQRIAAELKSLQENTNFDKCSYLYYEWFNELNPDYADSLQKMKEELSKASLDTIHKIAHLISLSYKEKL